MADAESTTKVSEQLEARIRRGREHLGKTSTMRDVAWQFFRGNHFAYADENNQLQFQSTVTTVRGTGKPRWKARQKRNLIYDAVLFETAGSTQRIPSYQVVPSTEDPEDRSAAGIAEKVLLYGHSIPATAIANPAEEHIVAKTQRLLDQLLDLGDNLSTLGDAVGVAHKSASELVGFSRTEVAANGWLKYPRLCRLAQVAPLDMTQQAFLARCKTLHEILQRLPDSFLKNLLVAAGRVRDEVKELGSLRLTQALSNVWASLEEKQAGASAFGGAAADIDWNARNPLLAALFAANELRKADAHEANNDWLLQLERLGFDSAQTNDGYGRALDFVMDEVTASLRDINGLLHNILARG